MMVVGTVTHPNGIEKIEIKNNNEIVEVVKFDKRVRSKDFKNIIELKEGNNKIEVTAYAKGSKKSERVIVPFEPLPPEIDLESAFNAQTRDEVYNLRMKVRDEVKLEEINK